MSLEEQLNATNVTLFLSSFRDASPIVLHQWYLSNLNRPIRIGIADPYPWAAVSLTEPRTSDLGETGDGKKKRKSKKKVCTTAILTPLSTVSLTFPNYRVVICLDISRSSFTLTSEGLPFATLTAALLGILEEMVLHLQSPSATAKKINVAVIAHAPENGETFNLWQGDVKEDSDLRLLTTQVRARVDVAEDLAVKSSIDGISSIHYKYPDVDTFLKAMMFYLDILPGDACPKAILLTSGCMKVDQCSSTHRAMSRAGISLHIMVEQLPCDRPIGFYSDISGLRLLAEHSSAGSLEILTSSDSSQISSICTKQFSHALFKHRVFCPRSSDSNNSDSRYLQTPIIALGNHLGTMREIGLFTYQCEGATVEHLIAARRAEGFLLVHITHEGPSNPNTSSSSNSSSAIFSAGTQIPSRTPFTAKAQYLSGLGTNQRGGAAGGGQQGDAGTVTLHLEKSITKMSSILYDITIRKDSAAQRASVINRLSAMVRNGAFMAAAGKSSIPLAGMVNQRPPSGVPLFTATSSGSGVDRHDILLEAMKEEHCWMSGTMTINIRRKCVRGGRHALNDENVTKQIAVIAQEILDRDKAMATLLGYAYLPGWIPSVEFAQSFSAMVAADRAADRAAVRRASLVSNGGLGLGFARTESSISMMSTPGQSSSANLSNMGMANTDTNQANANKFSRGPRWPTAKRIAGLADVLQDVCALDSVFSYSYFLRASEARVRGAVIASIKSVSSSSNSRAGGVGERGRRQGEEGDDSAKSNNEIGSNKRNGKIISNSTIKRAFDYVSAKLPNAEAKAVTPTKWVYVSCNKNQYSRRSSNPFDVRFGVIMLEANILHGVFLNLKIYKLAKGCGQLAALSKLAHDSFLYSLQLSGLNAHRLPSDLSLLSIVRSDAATAPAASSFNVNNATNTRSIPRSPTIGDSWLLSSSRSSDLVLRDRSQLETLVAEIVHSKVAFGFQYAAVDVDASSSSSSSSSAVLYSDAVFEDDFVNLMCFNGGLPGADSSSSGQLQPPPALSSYLRRMGNKSLLAVDDVGAKDDDDTVAFVVHLTAVCRKSPAGANMDSLLQCKVTCTNESSTVEYYWQKGSSAASDEAKLGGVYSKASAAASKTLEEIVGALMEVDEKIFRIYEVAVPLLRNTAILPVAMTIPTLPTDILLDEKIEKIDFSGQASTKDGSDSSSFDRPAVVLDWSSRPAQRVLYADWESLIARSTNQHITVPCFDTSRKSDSALLNGWLESMLKDSLLKSATTVLPVDIISDDSAEVSGVESLRHLRYRYVCGSGNTLVLIEIPKTPSAYDKDRDEFAQNKNKIERKKYISIQLGDFGVDSSSSGGEKSSIVPDTQESTSVPDTQESTSVPDAQESTSVPDAPHDDPSKRTTPYRTPRSYDTPDAAARSKMCHTFDVHIYSLTLPVLTFASTASLSAVNARKVLVSATDPTAQASSSEKSIKSTAAGGTGRSAGSPRHLSRMRSVQELLPVVDRALISYLQIHLWEHHMNHFTTVLGAAMRQRKCVSPVETQLGLDRCAQAVYEVDMSVMCRRKYAANVMNGSSSSASSSLSSGGRQGSGSGSGVAEPKGLVSLRSAFENSLGQQLLGVDDCDIFVMTRSFSKDASIDADNRTTTTGPLQTESANAAAAASEGVPKRSQNTTGDVTAISTIGNAASSDSAAAALEPATASTPASTISTQAQSTDTPTPHLYHPPASVHSGEKERERPRLRRRSLPTPVLSPVVADIFLTTSLNNSQSSVVGEAFSKEPCPTGRAVFVRFSLVARMNGDESGTSTVVQQHVLPCTSQTLTTSLFSLSNNLGQALESMHSSAANSEVALRMVCMYGPDESDPVDESDPILHDFKLSELLFESGHPSYLSSKQKQQQDGKPFSLVSSSSAKRRNSKESIHLSGAMRDRLELTRVSSMASMRSAVSYSSLHTMGSALTVPTGATAAFAGSSTATATAAAAAAISSTNGMVPVGGPPLQQSLSLLSNYSRNTMDSATSSLAGTPRGNTTRNLFNSSYNSISSINNINNSYMFSRTTNMAELTKIETSAAQISRLHCKGVFFDKLSQEMRVFVASDTLNSLQIASSAAITAETLLLVQHCLNDVPLLVKNSQLSLDFVSPISAKDGNRSSTASSYSAAASGFDPVVMAYETALREEIYGLSKIGDTLYTRLWRLTNVEASLNDGGSNAADSSTATASTPLNPPSEAAATAAAVQLIPCWILISLSHNTQSTGNITNGTATTNMKISISLRRTEIEASPISLWNTTEDHKLRKSDRVIDQEDVLQETIVKQLAVVLERCSFRVNQRLLLRDLLLTKVASPYLIAPPVAVAVATTTLRSATSSSALANSTTTATAPAVPVSTNALVAAGAPSTSTAVVQPGVSGDASSGPGAAGATASVSVLASSTAAGQTTVATSISHAASTGSISHQSGSSANLSTATATTNTAAAATSAPAQSGPIPAQTQTPSSSLTSNPSTSSLPSTRTTLPPTSSSASLTPSSIGAQQPASAKAPAPGHPAAAGPSAPAPSPKPVAPSSTVTAAASAAAATKSRIFNNIVPPRKRIMNPALAAIAGQAGPVALHGSTSSLLGPRQPVDGASGGEVALPPLEPTTFPVGRFSCQKQGEILCAMQGWAAMLYESAVRHLETSALSQFAVINQDRYFVAQDGKGDIFYMSFDNHTDRDCVRLGVYGVGKLDKQFCEQLQISLEHRLIEFIAKRLSETISRNIALPPSYLTFLRQSGASRHLVVKFKLPNYVQDVYYFCMIARQVLLSSNLLTKLVISGTLGGDGKKAPSSSSSSSLPSASTIAAVSGGGTAATAIAASGSTQPTTSTSSTTAATAAANSNSSPNPFSSIPICEVLHPAGLGYNLLSDTDTAPPAFPYAHQKKHWEGSGKKKSQEGDDEDDADAEDEADDYFGPDPRTSFTRLSRSSAPTCILLPKLMRPGLQRLQHVVEEDMYDPTFISPIFFGKKKPLALKHHEVRFDERLVVWQQPEFNFLYNVLQPLPAASPQQSKNAVKQIGFGLALVEFYPRPASASQTQTAAPSQTSGSSTTSSTAAYATADGSGGGNSNTVQILLTGTQHALEEDVKALEAHLKENKKLELLPTGAASAATSSVPEAAVESSATEGGDEVTSKSAGEIHLRILPTVPMQSHALAEFCQAYFEKALLVYCMERLFSAGGTGALTYPSQTTTPASPVASAATTSVDYLRNISAAHLEYDGDGGPPGAGAGGMRRSLRSGDFDNLKGGGWGGEGGSFDLRSTGMEDGLVIPRSPSQGGELPTDMESIPDPPSVQHHLPVPKRRLRGMSLESGLRESNYGSSHTQQQPPQPLQKSQTVNRTWAQVARGDPTSSSNDAVDSWRREVGQYRPGSPVLGGAHSSTDAYLDSSQRSLSPILAPRAQRAYDGEYSLSVNTKPSAVFEDARNIASQNRKDEDSELWCVPVNSLFKSTLFADFLRLMHSTIKAAKATPFVLNNSSGILHFPFLLPQPKAQSIRSRVIDRLVELYPFLRINMVNCLCVQLFLPPDVEGKTTTGVSQSSLQQGMKVFGVKHPLTVNTKDTDKDTGTMNKNKKSSSSSLLRWCSLRPAANDTANTSLMGVSSLSSNGDVFDEFCDTSSFMGGSSDTLTLLTSSPYGGIANAAPLSIGAPTMSRQSIHQQSSQSTSPSPPLGISHSFSTLERQQSQPQGKHNPHLGYMARTPLGTHWEHGGANPNPVGGIIGSTSLPVGVIPAAMAAAAATHGDLRMLPGFEGSIASSLPHWLRNRKLCIEVSVNTEGLYIHFFNIAYVHVQALCEIAATTTASAIKDHNEGLHEQLAQLGILHGKPGKVASISAQEGQIKGTYLYPANTDAPESVPLGPRVSLASPGSTAGLPVTASVASSIGALSSVTRSPMPVSVQSPLPTSVQSASASTGIYGLPGAKMVHLPLLGIGNTPTVGAAASVTSLPPAKSVPDTNAGAAVLTQSENKDGSLIRWVDNVMKKLCWDKRTLKKLFGKSDAEKKSVSGRFLTSSRSAASRAEELNRKEEQDCLHCVPLAAWRRGTVKSLSQIPLPQISINTAGKLSAPASVPPLPPPPSESSADPSSLSVSSLASSSPSPADVSFMALGSILRQYCEHNDYEFIDSGDKSSTVFVAAPVPRTAVIAVTEIRLIKKKVVPMARREVPAEPAKQPAGGTDSDTRSRNGSVNKDKDAVDGGSRDTQDEAIGRMTQKLVIPGTVSEPTVPASGGIIPGTLEMMTPTLATAPMQTSSPSIDEGDGNNKWELPQLKSSAASSSSDQVQGNGNIVITVRLVDTMEVIKSVAARDPVAMKYATTQLVVLPSLAIHQKGAEQLHLLTADALSDVTTAAAVLDHAVVKNLEKEILGCVVTLLHQSVLQRLAEDTAGAQALKVLRHVSPLLKDVLTFYEMEVPLTSKLQLVSPTASGGERGGEGGAVQLEDKNMGISIHDVVATLAAATDGLCTSQNGNQVQIWRDTAVVLNDTTGTEESSRSSSSGGGVVCIPFEGYEETLSSSPKRPKSQRPTTGISSQASSRKPSMTATRSNASSRRASRSNVSVPSKISGTAATAGSPRFNARDEKPSGSGSGSTGTDKLLSRGLVFLRTTSSTPQGHVSVLVVAYEASDVPTWPIIVPGSTDAQTDDETVSQTENYVKPLKLTAPNADMRYLQSAASGLIPLTTVPNGHGASRSDQGGLMVQLVRAASHVSSLNASYTPYDIHSDVTLSPQYSDIFKYLINDLRAHLRKMMTAIAREVRIRRAWTALYENPIFPLQLRPSTSSDAFDDTVMSALSYLSTPNLALPDVQEISSDYSDSSPRDLTVTAADEDEDDNNNNDVFPSSSSDGKSLLLLLVRHAPSITLQFLRFLRRPLLYLVGDADGLGVLSRNLNAAFQGRCSVFVEDAVVLKDDSGLRNTSASDNASTLLLHVLIAGPVGSKWALHLCTNITAPLAMEVFGPQWFSQPVSSPVRSNIYPSSPAHGNAPHLSSTVRDGDREGGGSDADADVGGSDVGGAADVYADPDLSPVSFADDTGTGTGDVSLSLSSAGSSSKEPSSSGAAHVPAYFTRGLNLQKTQHNNTSRTPERLCIRILDGSDSFDSDNNRNSDSTSSCSNSKKGLSPSNASVYGHTYSSAIQQVCVEPDEERKERGIEQQLLISQFVEIVLYSVSSTLSTSNSL